MSGMCETERVRHFPDLKPRLKLRSDIEQAVSEVNNLRHNETDLELIIEKMSKLIEKQQSYIGLLENTDSVTRMPDAFDKLQQSLDKFSMQTKAKRR